MGVRNLISHHKRRTLVILKIVFFVEQENAWDYHCAEWEHETHRKCVSLTRDAWDLAGLQHNASKFAQLIVCRPSFPISWRRCLTSLLQKWLTAGNKQCKNNSDDTRPPQPHDHSRYLVYPALEVSCWGRWKRKYWKTQVRKRQVRNSAFRKDGKRKYGKCKYNATFSQIIKFGTSQVSVVHFQVGWASGLQIDFFLRWRK